MLLIRGTRYSRTLHITRYLNRLQPLHRQFNELSSHSLLLLLTSPPLPPVSSCSPPSPLWTHLCGPSIVLAPPTGLVVFFLAPVCIIQLINIKSYHIKLFCFVLTLDLSIQVYPRPSIQVRIAVRASFRRKSTGIARLYRTVARLAPSSTKYLEGETRSSASPPRTFASLPRPSSLECCPPRPR